VVRRRTGRPTTAGNPPHCRETRRFLGRTPPCSSWKEGERRELLSLERGRERKKREK